MGQEKGSEERRKQIHQNFMKSQGLSHFIFSSTYRLIVLKKKKVKSYAGVESRKWKLPGLLIGRNESRQRKSQNAGKGDHHKKGLLGTLPDDRALEDRRVTAVHRYREENQSQLKLTTRLWKKFPQAQFNGQNTPDNWQRLCVEQHVFQTRTRTY